MLAASRLRPCSRSAGLSRPAAHAFRPATLPARTTRLHAVDQAIADMENITDFGEVGGPAEQEDVGLLPTDKVRLRIRMRGYDVGILGTAENQVLDIAEATGAAVAGPVHLPTKRKIYCVLRSPHVDKDSREHFEIRTHHRLVDVSRLSAQTVQALMEWVPPSGLEVETSIVPGKKITKGRAATLAKAAARKKVAKQRQREHAVVMAEHEARRLQIAEEAAAEAAAAAEEEAAAEQLAAGQQLTAEQLAETDAEVKAEMQAEVGTEPLQE